MSGTMLTTPEVTGSGHWYVTAVSGQRVQTGANASSVSITGLGGIPFNGASSFGSEAYDNEFSRSV